MKIWIDDVWPAPKDYVWLKSVNEAKKKIIEYLTIGIAIELEPPFPLELLDMDHDAGDYYNDGGDFIEILKWFEKTKTPCPPIRIHSMNPVGVANMRAIIERNGWEEVR